MSILTDKTIFSGTPATNDLIHMVDVSDSTDNPAGTSFALEVGSLDTSLWSAGTGTNSIVAKNSGSVATGTTSHAKGSLTQAYGTNSHAEGLVTKAHGDNSHAEGSSTMASGDNSHSEGSQTEASGDNSHSEGTQTTASGSVSHAEGGQTTASGSFSHSEGSSTRAEGDNSHAGGFGSVASGDTSFSHQSTAGGLTNGSGVYADYSAILGGTNNILTTSATRSVILGGENITGSTANMTYVTDLYIDNCPAYDDDTAAGVGGLTAGMVFQATGAGTEGLGVLMIKQ